MKLLNEIGLRHLIGKIKEMIGKKADTEYVDNKVKTDVPLNAIFTDTIYTHPSTHSASMINESPTKRFVTDAEKSNWNSKETTTGAQNKATKALADANTYTDNRVKTPVPAGALFTDTTAWTGITGKPSTFTPNSHTHSTAQITDINQPLRTTDRVQFGQIGVGTATPNFPVDVVGDVRIREESKLKMGGSGANDVGFELAYDKTTKSVNFNFN